MTRINVGIPPKRLTDRHLLAEHREIKRIPNAIVSGRAKVAGIPPKFTLGTGHVKFFYDKCSYLLMRYHEIYKECKRRGFNVTYYGDAWDNIPLNLMGVFFPKISDSKLLVTRIKERGGFKPKY